MLLSTSPPSNPTGKRRILQNSFDQCCLCIAAEEINLAVDAHHETGLVDTLTRIQVPSREKIGEQGRAEAGAGAGNVQLLLGLIINDLAGTGPLLGRGGRPAAINSNNATQRAITGPSPWRSSPKKFTPTMDSHLLSTSASSYTLDHDSGSQAQHQTPPPGSPSRKSMTPPLQDKRSANITHPHGKVMAASEKNATSMDADALTRALKDVKDAGRQRERTPGTSPSRKRQRIYGDRWVLSSSYCARL